MKYFGGCSIGGIAAPPRGPQSHAGARPAGSAILPSVRLSVAIRSISSLVSAKSNTSRFSAMRAAFDERGIGTMLPCWIGQRLRAEPDCFVEQRDIEIGNADLACETLALRFGERADRLAERDLRVRPMDHEKVDVIDSVILQALLDRAREVVRAQIFVRHFGGQEDLAARHAGGAHALADAALGPVFPRRVDVTVAELERGRDDLAAIAQRGGAKADGRHLGAVRG